MTEKRFTWIKNTYASFGTIIDNQTNKDMMGTKETCSFMNKQEELIEELKDYQTVLSEDLANCTDERIRLQNENEQLKEKNEKWKEKYFTMGEMFSKQVDNIDEVNNILVDADTMNKEQLIRKIDKVINND